MVVGVQGAGRLSEVGLGVSEVVELRDRLDRWLANRVEEAG